MLKGQPDAADLQRTAAGLGLRLVLPETTVPLWAELVPAVELFAAMQTQWVLDAAGELALNYAALPVVEARIGIPARRRRQVFADLREMEAEARRMAARRSQSTFPPARRPH